MDRNLRAGITEILMDLSRPGVDKSLAAERLYDAVYDEMRRMAARLMSAERPDHTLQPTELVHEAYLRLVDETRIQWQDRAHFFATAARVMRHILVDYARRKAAGRRGGGWRRITLDSSLGLSTRPLLETLVLDQALSRLADLDDRMSRVVELRVFGGMTMREIAHTLGVSKRTVDGDWMVARRWLRHELAEEVSS